MTPTLIAIISFGTLFFGLAGIMFLMQDLGTARDGAGRGAFRLRRLPLDRNAPQPRTIVGRFDRWFLRLMVESGMSWSPVTAVLFMLLLGTIIGGTIFLFSDAPVPGMLGMIVGMTIGMVCFMVVRSRRMRQVQTQLPSALEMLARAVRAGESLDQAVHLVGDKSPEPLSVEFRRCANQLSMGISMAAVMRALVHRLQLTDVRIFTTTLTVHRQTGGNLAWTLERLAGVIRERLAYRRQMRASTAAGRMSATLIAAIGPLLFVYLFFAEPQYVSGLTQSPLGQSLLAAAVFLEIVGLVWIARMLRTDF